MRMILNIFIIYLGEIKMFQLKTFRKVFCVYFIVIFFINTAQALNVDQSKTYMEDVYKDLKEHWQKISGWLEKLEESAEIGTYEGRFLLGLMLLRGDGVIKNEERGLSLLQAGASKGCYWCELALIFLNDNPKAVKDFITSEMGKVVLMVKQDEWDEFVSKFKFKRENLLSYYDNLYDTEKKWYLEKKGIDGLEKDALTGIGQAIFVFGLMLIRGDGVAKNKDRGLSILQKSASNGFINSAMALIFNEDNPDNVEKFLRDPFSQACFIKNLEIKKESQGKEETTRDEF